MDNQKTRGHANDVPVTSIAAMQKWLINYYRTRDLTVLTPAEDYSDGLNRLYVKPDIRVFAETTYPSRSRMNVTDQASSSAVCKRLFYTSEYRCKQIYLIGDAAIGKSTFCKHLLSLWCEAHCNTIVNASSKIGYHESGTDRGGVAELYKDTEIKPEEEREEEEDRKIMAEFELVFHVTLRDALDLYKIEDMIDVQILQQIKDTPLKASVVLEQTCCLIILDGLDEWMRPSNKTPQRRLSSGLPGRKTNNKNVILTTTRPWKLHVLDLKRSEIDKKVELVGLNSTASEILYSRVQSITRPDIAPKYKFFIDELKKNNLTHFLNVPIMLIQLISFWFDRQSLGQSQVQLYSIMLEMLLLKRPNRSQIEQPFITTSDTDVMKQLLPACFSNHIYCLEKQHLILSLGKLSFKVLFNQEKELSLILKNSQFLDQGINQNSIDLCLQSGLLSDQSAHGRTPVHGERILMFTHKTLQEFLAALFITTNYENENIQSQVKGFCNTIEHVLERSMEWMFVSGIDHKLSCQLLTDLITRVVFTDRRLQQNRETLGKPDLPRAVQTCILDCILEARSNGHKDFWLPLKDFVVQKQKQIACLHGLLKKNIADVESVDILTKDLTNDDVDCTLRLLQDAESSLRRLHVYDLHDDFIEKTLCHTISTQTGNLTSLKLENVTVTTETSAVICSTLKNLVALRLVSVILSHKGKEYLESGLSQMGDIKFLSLGLYCEDHKNTCQFCVNTKDLTLLRTLDLFDMHLGILSVANCVQRVNMTSVTLSERQLWHFVQAVSSIPHTVTVEMCLITVTKIGGHPVDLTYLKHFERLLIKRWGEYMFNDMQRWDIKFQTKTVALEDKQTQT